MEPLRRAMMPAIKFPSLPPCAYWSLPLLVLAFAAHLPALNGFSPLLLVLALCSRMLPPRFWVPALRLALLVGAVVSCGLLWGWLDNRTIRTALLLVLALKWAEARSAREFALIASAGLVAGAVGLLQWGEWAGLAFVALLALLALAVLETATAGQYGIEIKKFSPLRTGGSRLALALPLAAVFFLFFPRIPGPLWDIGLSFGLPLAVGLEKSNQGLGVSTRLKPGEGQRQTGVSEEQPVLVAEFDGWVPPTSLLYWRGPVYYEFDGYEWHLAPEFETGQGRILMRQGWAKAAEFSATLARATQEISYSVRLTPHDRLWLYGLDLPAALAAESFVSADWQVLAHRPVETETQFRLKSWLDWESGGTLDESLRARALALPAGGNPRLRALGEQLAARPLDERLQSVLGALSKDGYKVRDTFEFQEGADAFDTFWFDSRTGNADLYAGAFVFLMRAANVPARLVTGYRGGKLMALTDYVIVKRNHAHAWAEIWDETRGWRRIDPVDLIAPERFAETRQTAPQPKPAQAAPTPQKQPPAPQTAQAAPRTETPAAAAKPAPQTLRSVSLLDDWVSRWLFRLDAQEQQALLAGLGKQLGERLGKTLGGKFAWVWLLVGAALGSAAVMAGMQAVVWWRETRHLPPPQRAWNRAQRLLAKRGFPIEAWECPSAFALRVGEARPPWRETLEALAHAYTDWRYAAACDDAPQRRRIEAHARKLHNLILASH